MRRGKKKTIFLDRDGTINKDVGYNVSLYKFDIMPGVIEALLRFQSLGYQLIVITNQSGIARGFFTEDDVNILHEFIKNKFKKYGIEIKDVAYCPHYPNGKIARYSRVCNCRKPKPGLILRQSRKHYVCRSQSFMIGDKTSDKLAGQRAGCIGIKIGDRRYSKDLKSFSIFLFRKYKARRTHL